MGHRNLIKNKTQTTVINILNLHKLLVRLLFSLFLGVFVQRHNASLRSKLRQNEVKLTPKGLENTQIGTPQEHGEFRNIPDRTIIAIMRDIGKIKFSKIQ